MPHLRSRITVARWIIGVTAVLALRTTGAQRPATPDAAARRPADPLCWRGRPLARCRAFVLVEFSAPRHLVGSRLDPVVAQPGSGHPRWDQGLASQFVYDLGAMVNVGERSAIGGTLTAGVITDDPSTPLVLGVTGRYRRWLTRTVSADAAVGVLRMPVGVVERRAFGDQELYRTSVHRPAVMAEARLGYGDLVAVSARGMLATDGRGRTHHALLAGASIGSTTTAVATAASAAWIALLFGLFYAGGDF